MNRTGFEDTQFFWGHEVEHTPALGQRTLFVVGYRGQEAIDRELAKRPEVRHIFFGANDSYHPQSWQEHTAWENVISSYLDRGFWCSLDIPFDQVAEFNDSGLCERDQFIPIIKVPIPYVRLWNYNTCVKIDDRDFADTNPGVWTHSLHELQDRAKFTAWSEYSKDHPSE
jgi:hypothetical protein